MILKLTNYKTIIKRENKLDSSPIITSTPSDEIRSCDERLAIMFTDEWHSKYHELEDTLNNLSIIEHEETFILNNTDQEILEFLDTKDRNLKRCHSSVSICSQPLRKK
jgi:hypothetical protein